MNPFRLVGKSILVTGASSGIGQRIAIEASLAGARLFVTGRDAGRLNETLDRLEKGPDHQSFLADITKAEDIDKLCDTMPQLDGFVHSAGISLHKPARMIRESDIEKSFNINFNAAVLLVSRLLKTKKMNEGASLVFLSSGATRYTYFGGAMYTASKAALEAYCKVLALEIAPKKMRANCLVPSFVETPMVEGAGQVISDEVLEEFRKRAPLGFGQTSDVALPAVFFLSDASRWITGTSLPIGGIF